MTCTAEERGRRAHCDVPAEVRSLPSELWTTEAARHLALRDLLSLSEVCKAFAVFPAIKEMSRRPQDRVTDAFLRSGRLPGLVHLRCAASHLRCRHNSVTDEGLAHLPCLASLVVYPPSSITNAGLVQLRGTLKMLWLAGIGKRDPPAHSPSITEAGVAQLTCLTQLSLDSCPGITGNMLGALVNLRHLQLSTSYPVASARSFTDAGFSGLGDRLVSLVVAKLVHVTDASLAQLRNLTRLDIPGNQRVTDAGLARLTRLRRLAIRQASRVTDAGIGPLASLTALDIGENASISDAGIARLSKLVRLEMTSCYGIEGPGLLSSAPSLTHLDLTETHFGYLCDYVACMPRLTHLARGFDISLERPPCRTDSVCWPGGLQIVEELPDMTPDPSDAEF